MRSTKTERRMVERARVILLAANGLNGKEIAARMETRTARVSKWLRRFAKDRIAGLLDAPRPGEKRRKYNPATEAWHRMLVSYRHAVSERVRNNQEVMSSFVPARSGTERVGARDPHADAGDTARRASQARDDN